jgi:hypothetical protein
MEVCAFTSRLTAISNGKSRLRAKSEVQVLRGNEGARAMFVDAIRKSV